MGVPRAGPSRERQSGQTTATDSDRVGIPPRVATRVSVTVAPGPARWANSVPIGSRSVGRSNCPHDRVVPTGNLARESRKPTGVGRNALNEGCDCGYVGYSKGARTMQEPDFSFLGDTTHPSRPTGDRKAAPPEKLPANPWPKIIILGFLGFLVISAIWGVNAKYGMQAIHDQVFEDAARQYQISRDNGGSHIDLHVHAGLAAEAALQADDAEAYAKWIKVRDAHARKAGM
jgi:hypothetical protein